MYDSSTRMFLRQTALPRADGQINTAARIFGIFNNIPYLFGVDRWPYCTPIAKEFRCARN
jgi:hypothetical protein